MRWALLGVLVFAAAGACKRSSADTKDPLPRNSTAKTADLPPVPLNPVSPIAYPPALLAQQIEGRVLLRLHVDSTGRLVPDSVHVAESSGYPALDSAAIDGARALRFSPALHYDRPIALSFIQPILFRVPRLQGAVHD